MIAALLVILACIWLVWTLTVFIRVVMNLGAAAGCLVRIVAMVALLIVQAGVTGVMWAMQRIERRGASGNVISLDQYRFDRAENRNPSNVVRKVVPKSDPVHF